MKNEYKIHMRCLLSIQKGGKRWSINDWSFAPRDGTESHWNPLREQSTHLRGAGLSRLKPLRPGRKGPKTKRKERRTMNAHNA
jgi:hypothetical protein